MCKNIYDHCVDCTGYMWMEYDKITIKPPNGEDPVIENIPGHCVLSFP